MNSRGRSRSRSPLQDVPKFPLIITLPEHLIGISDLHSLNKSLIEELDLDRVHISDQLGIANFEYIVVYIYARSTTAKLDCLKRSLNLVGSDVPSIAIGVLIPPSMVTVLVGKHGTCLLYTSPSPRDS